VLPTVPRQIIAIQYLRAFAALAVIYRHVFENRLGSSLKEGAIGIWGIDIFFVISGFIMWTTTSDGRSTPASFWKRRIIRIYPIYWVALTIWIVSRVIVPDRLANADVSAESITLSYLLVPHYHLVFTSQIWPILIPGWTLQFEIFFYFIFGLFLFVRQRAWRAGFILSSLVALVVIGAITTPSSAALSIYTSPLLLEFAGGVVLGIVFESGLKLPVWAAASASVIAVFFLITAEHLFYDYGRCLFFGVPALLLTFGFLSLEERIERRPIAVLTTLGDASYSLYLFHAIIFAAVAVAWERIATEAQPAAFVTVALIVSIVASVGIHFLIERPLIRLFRPTGTPVYRHKASESVSILRDVFDRPVADETLWHQTRGAPPPFARTISGSPISGLGRIWRRKRNGKWEYQQDPETAEEFEDRQGSQSL
jgi:exopolysaccharide production protein ExoZ